MSSEDQNATIVRLLRELSEAKKEWALVRESLREDARRWTAFSQALHGAVNGAVGEARRAAAELLHRENLQQTRSLLDDAERLPRRIEEIQATLKAAGIDV